MPQIQNNEEEVYELDWDEEIDDGSQFKFENYIFPEGDYTFKVAKFDRGKSKENNNNMAILDLEITDGEHVNTVRDWLVLTNKNIWKIASFFRSVGLKKHGEKTQMKWKESVGLTGTCTLKVEDRVSKRGTAYKVNQVDKYLDPVDDVPTDNFPTENEDNFEW